MWTTSLKLWLIHVLHCNMRLGETVCSDGNKYVACKRKFITTSVWHKNILCIITACVHWSDRRCNYKIAKSKYELCRVCLYGTAQLPLGRFFVTFDIWVFFWRSVEKIQILLKSDKNGGNFTWRHIYISDDILAEYFLEWEMFRTIDVEKITYLMFNTFFFQILCCVTISV
jgi:hypothetical protein